MQCRVGDLGEAALPSQHTSSSPAAEPPSADAGTVTLEMAAVTFSGLLTKAWIMSMVPSTSFW